MLMKENLNNNASKDSPVESEKNSSCGSYNVVSSGVHTSFKLVAMSVLIIIIIYFYF